MVWCLVKSTGTTLPLPYLCSTSNSLFLNSHILSQFVFFSDSPMLWYHCGFLFCVISFTLNTVPPQHESRYHWMLLLRVQRNDSCAVWGLMSKAGVVRLFWTVDWCIFCLRGIQMHVLMLQAGPWAAFCNIYASWLASNSSCTVFLYFLWIPYGGNLSLWCPCSRNSQCDFSRWKYRLKFVWL